MSFRYIHPNTNWNIKNYCSDHKCNACVQHSKGLDTIGKCFYCYRENKDLTFGWYVENGKEIKDKSYMDWNTYVKYREYLETLDDYDDWNNYDNYDNYDK